MPHLPLDLARQSVVSFGVAAHDLDVDRRRQPEVQNLAGHIGRFEVDRRLGEARVQTLAQPVLVFAR